MCHIGKSKLIRGDDWIIVAGTESVLISAVLRFDGPWFLLPRGRPRPLFLEIRAGAELLGTVT
jgi:hypothetical protein